MDATESKSKKRESKAIRKVTRKLSSLLAQEKDLEVSKIPTEFVFVGNGGLMCGIDRVSLLTLFQRFGQVRRVDMFSQRAFSLVTFANREFAAKAYASIHARELIFPYEFDKKNQVFYLAFLRGIPKRLLADQGRLPTALVGLEDDGTLCPLLEHEVPGLIIKRNFVSEEEEFNLLARFGHSNSRECEPNKIRGDGSRCDQNNKGSGDPIPRSELKHRRVKHYGYEFRYDTNNVDITQPLEEKIPVECLTCLQEIKRNGWCKFLPDQLTVNEYLPSQGIPPHIDTHSAFEDGIISLSLGSQVVMDFRHPDGRHVPVFLPQRSLLVMTGESRYLWSHGITPRRYDIIAHASESGSTTLIERRSRISLTFRKVRTTKCDCAYPLKCDSQGFRTAPLPKENHSGKVEIELLPQSGQEAVALESRHVHEVYEKIAEHFSGTRHSPWPRIADFLRNLPAGSFVADVGCGNGKYMGVNPGIHMFGSDRSLNLTRICMDRGFSVIVSDILKIPYRDDAFDACICIAVIHHLSTSTRRLDAVKELLRIVKPNGLVLISVWAYEQYDENTSTRVENNEPVPCTGKGQIHVIHQGKTTLDVEGSHDSFVHAQSEQSSSHSTSNDSSLGDDCRRTIIVNQARGTFEQQDLFVPWRYNKGTKKERDVEGEGKDEATVTPVFQRFYHVFVEGELEELCSRLNNVCIEGHYFDRGNWCVILKKGNKVK